MEDMELSHNTSVDPHRWRLNIDIFFSDCGRKSYSNITSKNPTLYLQNVDQPRSKARVVNDLDHMRRVKRSVYKSSAFMEHLEVGLDSIVRQKLTEKSEIPP
jgi:hypothetical protein